VSDTATAAIDTTINAFRSDIEKAAMNDRTWGGLAIDTHLIGAEHVAPNDDGIDGITVRIAVEYRVKDNDPYAKG